MHLSCTCNSFTSSPSISKFISDHPSLHMLETQCSSMKELHQLHSHIIKTGLAKDPIAISRLLSFTTTSPFPDLNYAFLLFTHTKHPTLFMWNTLIRAFSNSSNPNLAMSIFQQMLLSPTQPNHLTFPSLFKSYAHLGLANEGSQLHAMVIKLGLTSDQYIHNSILAMYACCGELAVASQLFSQCLSFDVVACNAMILGLAKRGCLDESRHLFDEMPTRTVVTWSSMISGYLRNGRNKEVFDLFHQMQREGVKPNDQIMVTLLGACSSLGALEQGKWVHSFITKNEIANNPIVITAIINMYFKCGSIEEAIETFESSSVKCLSSWNSVILGLATHGRGKEAIQLFTRLQHSSVLEPDNVSFISVLTACSHSGMVEEAISYFKLMKKVYDIEPSIEHYGCLVDVLGRAGLVKEAKNLVQRMPVEPDSVIWGSLLSACRVHRNAEIGNEAAARLLKLDPWDSGGYVILSNSFASEKDFNGSAKARGLMREMGVNKERGCSLIEIDGEVHEFVPYGVMHHRAGDIYQILDGLLMSMKGASCNISLYAFS